MSETALNRSDHGFNVMANAFNMNFVCICLWLADILYTNAAADADVVHLIHTNKIEELERALRLNVQMGRIQKQTKGEHGKAHVRCDVNNEQLIWEVITID